jgi:hypothetical protein
VINFCLLGAIKLVEGSIHVTPVESMAWKVKQRCIFRSTSLGSKKRTGEPSEALECTFKNEEKDILLKKHAVSISGQR